MLLRYVRPEKEGVNDRENFFIVDSKKDNEGSKREQKRNCSKREKSKNKHKDKGEREQRKENNTKRKFFHKIPHINNFFLPSRTTGTPQAGPHVIAALAEAVKDRQ